MIELGVTSGETEREPVRAPGLRERLSAYPRPVVIVGFALALVAASGVGYLGLRDSGGGASGRDLTAHVAVGDDELAITGPEARLRGIATVTNVDDEPAVVHALSAEWPGVRIAVNDERVHRVAPGATAPMGVTITFTCAYDTLRGLHGRALVDTPDGGRGEVDLPITAVRPWQAMRHGACETIQSRPADRRPQE
ncbi:hypothetical protein J2S43_005272 [Catenuloplanes nepalensis]|uniref:Uncharacterized protein n=1 Tax=Catenuloplanes nepalensis TaxID=587533 RepID=A0ABT9MZ83_9ACTN|nr:hypothetical protein [Catenuloplanes nepalensis]MDP9796760.1 hypothetical protein [Catenuloplanes nepalensis]